MANIAKSVVKGVDERNLGNHKVGLAKLRVTNVLLVGHGSSSKPAHDQRFGHCCWLHARVRM